MRDFISKVKILYVLMLEAFYTWHEAVYIHNLDDNHCCSGAGCCCGGITIRDVYLKDRILK